jgi:hypothetical protein
MKIVPGDASWIEWDLEGSVHGQMEVLCRNLRGGTDRNHEKHVKIDGIVAEMRTKHLPNASLEQYL